MDASPSNSDTVTDGPSEPPPTACLTHSIPPLCSAAIKVPLAPQPYLQIVYLNDFSPKDDVFVQSVEQPNATTPVFEATVLSARKLTVDPCVKRAYEIEIQADIDYLPGDSFGVVMPNRSSEVDYLVDRLHITHVADKKISLQIMADTQKKAAKIPEYIALPSTIRSILKHDLDLCAVPRKAFLRMLVDYTSDPAQKRRLQELCSTHGAKDYNSFLRDPYFGLVQLLKTFNTCSPPIERIMEHCPRLLAREYSMACSPATKENSIKFVFNVVDLPDFGTEKRKGLFTGWIEEELTKSGETSLCEQMSNLNISCLKLPIYARKETPFRFPENPGQPVMMVGPGAGIAPFIGFLQHRKEIMVQDPSVSLGEAVLFYGCRHEKKDFLYREEIGGYLLSGVLTDVHTCFSRDDPSSELRYVQHQIVSHADYVMNLIFEKQGAVFICGDAKMMGRDVMNAFVEMIMKYRSVGKIDAMKIVKKLAEDGQYLEDVWT